MSPTHAPFDLSDDAFRALGTDAINLMIVAIAQDRVDPVLRPVSGRELRTTLDEPLPEEGQPPETIFTEIRDRILPYCRHNGHPRFFGYVCTSPDPVGILADAVASSMNQLVTAWRSTPAAAEVERLVIRWMHELVGFGGDGGLLVSGGSSANFHALATAVAEAERRPGVTERGRHGMTAYVSQEGHVSMFKALRVLGLRDEHIRRIATDEERRVSVADMKAAIARDRDNGLVPVAVCGSSGTANTGAIDPLLDLAALARSEGLWYHVDGSYGAPAVLVDEFAWMGAAFAMADSMSLDPHKWLFAPADAGCLLVRDESALRRTFSASSEYVEVTQTDSIERYAFFDHGLEMSRRFRGLKVWAILKARGRDGIRAAIAHDISLREYLDARIEEEPYLESLGSDLSISCFRFRPDDRSEDELTGLNRSILESIVREGRAYMSPTTLDGRYGLRVCIVNFRTTKADIDLLVDEVLRIGGLYLRG